MIGLLICPTCKKNGDHYVMGSIDHNGHMHIQRYSSDGGTTIITANSYIAAHYCGFSTAVSSSVPDKIIYTWEVKN